MADREHTERDAGFTDASYVTREDAPNTPHCFSSSDDKNKNGSAIAVAGLCIALFVLGSLVNTMCTSAYNGNRRTVTPDNSEQEAETVSTSIVNAAAATARPKSTAAPAQDRPYLGVVVQTVSSAAAEYYNGADESNRMVPGVQVYAIDEEGPAAEAGLQCGDIITGMDDKIIESADDLTDFETECAPGENAVATVYRDGEYVEVSVTFADPPEGEESEEHWYGTDEAW